jgi:hypothetical protein
LREAAGDAAIPGTGISTRPLSGGERLTEGAMAKGFFVPPTVFADVRDDLRRRKFLVR